MPTKRLAADHRADLVAVDVYIAGHNTLRNISGPVGQAGLQTKSQPVAGVIDRFNHCIDLVAGKGCKMQYGAENLLFQGFNAADADQRGGDIVAL